MKLKICAGPWSCDGLYYLLRFGRKNRGYYDEYVKFGEAIPDEEHARLFMAALKAGEKLEKRNIDPEEAIRALPKLIKALQAIADCDDKECNWRSVAISAVDLVFRKK